jgi:thiol:disulfide interchange protein DsbD
MKTVMKWMAALALLAQLMPLASGPARAADDFLAPEQAFALAAELRRDPGGQSVVHLAWTIAPGYHLYRDRLVFDGAQVTPPALPAGARKFDENFGKEMETYTGTLAVDLPVKAGTAAPFALKVGYQGCADAGLCYPPAEVALNVDPAAPGAIRVAAVDGQGAAPAAPAAPAAAAPAAPQAAAASGEPHEDDSSLAQRTLKSGSLWRIGLAFMAFGLLLSFTPCVLPMVPILSSIIVGEQNVSRGKGFVLAASYSLGMALVYTALGSCSW